MRATILHRLIKALMATKAMDRGLQRQVSVTSEAIDPVKMPIVTCIQIRTARTRTTTAKAQRLDVMTRKLTPNH